MLLAVCLTIGGKTVDAVSQLWNQSQFLQVWCYHDSVKFCLVYAESYVMDCDR